MKFFYFRRHPSSTRNDPGGGCQRKGGMETVQTIHQGRHPGSHRGGEGGHERPPGIQEVWRPLQDFV